MTHYSFTTLLRFKQRKKYQCLTIHFDYYLPEQFGEWHDPEYGSIQIIEILDAFSNKPLPLSDIIHLIRLRRCCWNYLENRQLIFQHNIKPLFI